MPEQPAFDNDIAAANIVKDEPDVLTQMIDNATFTAGGKTYEAEDEIPLTFEETTLLQEIRDLEEQNTIIKQYLLDLCHPSERKIIAEIRPATHLLGLNTATIKYNLYKMVNRLHSRLGGLLPLKLDDDLTTFTVRAIAPNENINYTVQKVLSVLGVQDILHQRELAFKIAEKRSDSGIDMSVSREYGFQPVFVKYVPHETDMITGIEAFLKEFPRPTKTLILCTPVWLYIINLGIEKPGRWNKIAAFAKEVNTTVVFVLEPFSVKDPKASEVALSKASLLGDSSISTSGIKFTIRVDDKTVEKKDGEFFSTGKEMYENLLKA